MLDMLTVKAHGLARSWGISFTTTTHRRVEPCARARCQGSIMAFGDGLPSRCLLCCRGDDGADTEADQARESLLAELMA